MIDTHRLKNKFLIIDYETKDPYIGMELGAGWAYEVCYRKGIGRTLYLGIGRPGDYYYCAACDSASYRTFLKAYDNNSVIVGHNLQYDLGWLLVDISYSEKDSIEKLRELYRSGVLLVDTKILAHLIDEHKIGKSYSLEALAKEYKVSQKTTKKLIDACWESGLYVEICSTTDRKIRKRPADDRKLSKVAYSNLDLMPPNIVMEYCVDDVKATKELYFKFLDILMNEYDQQTLFKLLKTYSDLQYCCIEMRIHGMNISNSKLNENFQELNNVLKNAESKLNEMAGREVQESIKDDLVQALINSGYKESDFKKTKTGLYSITDAWLQSQDSDICKEVVRIRKIKKCLSMFFAKIIKIRDYCEIDKDQSIFRIHPEFNIFRARTGRFSCSNPNVQQSFKRDPDFYKVCRGCFVAPRDYVWSNFDYSSQENRIQVHYGVLLKASGADIIANKWIKDPYMDYHSSVAELTDLPRKKAKAINLGLSYRMGEAKLCKSLSLPTQFKTFVYNGKKVKREVAGHEGKLIIEQYHKLMPFMRETIKKVSDHMDIKKKIKLISGRYAHIEYIKYGTGHKKESSFKAFSQLIQGSAADQLIASMVDIYKYVVSNYLDDMIMCGIVHDEILFLLGENKSLAYKKIIEDLMVNSFKLKVPMVVDGYIGKSWYEEPSNE